MQEVMAAMSRLQVATETYAALGARLSISPTDDVAPEIVSALDDVLAAAGIDINTLEPQQRMMIAGLVRTMFAQSGDLLARPARAPGWSYTDSALLEGIGRASMMMPTLLATAPELANVSSLLDIGTGVGLLAVAATQTWPECAVVGIDVWEPSLDLARNNVKGANLDNRIELRMQDLADIDDVERFDCVWFPTFFFSREAIIDALPKLSAALTGGGHVVLAHADPPTDALVQATNRLRTVRDGGSGLDSEGATQLLGDAGYDEVHSIPRTTPVPIGFVIGRKR
jgi:SAM-dependent methyltransferase